jgi:uncharacterized Fe-S cluster-containing radical SAM superfamily protein
LQQSVRWSALDIWVMVSVNIPAAPERSMTMIDTDAYSAHLRAKAIDSTRQALLITDLRGSGQEDDLSEPVNCGGYGRIRHFRQAASAGWPPNPLPAVPASAALGIAAGEEIRAQVFQNSVCNWRCWYCYVPFSLLSGNQRRSAWFTATELVEAYLAGPDPPAVLDLSGGQPDLVPEWVPWTLQALADRGADRVYVWLDDNLSNDYFWWYLTDAQRELAATHPRYGRVCCFKGFDAESFAFNTRAAPELFARQFDLFARLLATGMDLYAYATFTGPAAGRIGEKMARFADRLQQVAPNLPLRTVPLEIDLWGPVKPRITPARQHALSVQAEAISAWNTELEARFPAAARQVPITKIRLTAQDWQ